MMLSEFIEKCQTQLLLHGDKEVGKLNYNSDYTEHDMDIEVSYSPTLDIVEVY